MGRYKNPITGLWAKCHKRDNKGICILLWKIIEGQEIIRMEKLPRNSLESVALYIYEDYKDKER